MNGSGAMYALLVLLLSTSRALHQCPIVIKEDGQALNLHVAALTSNLVVSDDNGTSISMKYGEQTRAFVVDRSIDDMPVDNYHNFALLGKELSYDVDLSTVGCSCNAALFFVSMPGYSENGSVAHGSYNPFYCDANKVGGVWCWEHDSIEANMHTLATTPHKCSSTSGSYIESCDRAGCQTNAFFVDRNGLCPNARCKIDTRSPFRISQRFAAESGKLSSITNTLVQENRTFDWTVCSRNTNYLREMSESLQQMKMVFQLWGTDWLRMSWLDGMTGCLGGCNNDNTIVKFSNIEINTLSASEPHSSESSEQIVFL